MYAHIVTCLHIQSHAVTLDTCTHNCIYARSHSHTSNTCNYIYATYHVHLHKLTQCMQILGCTPICTYAYNSHMSVHICSHACTHMHTQSRVNIRQRTPKTLCSVFRAPVQGLGLEEPFGGCAQLSLMLQKAWEEHLHLWEWIWHLEKTLRLRGEIERGGDPLLSRSPKI